MRWWSSAWLHGVSSIELVFWDKRALDQDTDARCPSQIPFSRLTCGARQIAGEEMVLNGDLSMLLLWFCLIWLYGTRDLCNLYLFLYSFVILHWRLLRISWMNVKVDLKNWLYLIVFFLKKLTSPCIVISVNNEIWHKRSVDLFVCSNEKLQTPQLYIIPALQHWCAVEFRENPLILTFPFYLELPPSLGRK